MAALVIYEGNTEKVARAICAGMKQNGRSDVECKAVENVSTTDLSKADYWIMGAPSSGFLAGRKTVGLLKKSVGVGSKATGVVFDTRMAGERTGIADKMTDILKAANVKMASSTYFSMGSDKNLLSGEEDLAMVFGKNLVSMMK